MQLERRGVFAGLGTVLTAAWARWAVKPAAAADGDPLIIGQNNAGSGETMLTRTGGTPAVAFRVHDEGEPGYAVVGVADSIGIFGSCTSAYGAGVYGGAAGDPGEGYGVWGISYDGVGVRGESVRSGWGVVGGAPRGGVVGVALDPGGIGVSGSSPGTETAETYWRQGFGVVGTCDLGVGVVGRGGHYGVHGAAGKTGKPGVFAESNPAGRSWALATAGHAYVEGNLIVARGVKSAAMPHPDGSLRLTYTLEGPESWFMDFGRARLERGEAEVRLDPDFATLVHTDEYHVFLTSEGESRGIYVSDRGPDRFRVKEQQDGRSSIAFGYQVVARRKDVEAPRLDKFTAPPLDPMGGPPPAELTEQPAFREPPVPPKPSLPPDVPRRQ